VKKGRLLDLLNAQSVADSSLQTAFSSFQMQIRRTALRPSRKAADPAGLLS
jgi:hypothetical protein